MSNISLLLAVWHNQENRNHFAHLKQVEPNPEKRFQEQRQNEGSWKQQKKEKVMLRSCHHSCSRTHKLVTAAVFWRFCNIWFWVHPQNCSSGQATSINKYAASAQTSGSQTYLIPPVAKRQPPAALRLTETEDRRFSLLPALWFPITVSSWRCLGEASNKADWEIKLETPSPSSLRLRDR